MQDGDLVSVEAGGTVQLTVVGVELPVGAAHGFVVRFALVQTAALAQTCAAVHHAVTAQTAVLVLTRFGEAIVGHQTWKERGRRHEKLMQM